MGLLAMMFGSIILGYALGQGFLGQSGFLKEPDIIKFRHPNFFDVNHTISLEDNVVLLKFPNARSEFVWSEPLCTGSMWPTLICGAVLLEWTGFEEKDLYVGDVIHFYLSEQYTNAVHRIIFIGEDINGWYAITKGDNNTYQDEPLIRLGTIKAKIVGVLN